MFSRGGKAESAWPGVGREFCALAAPMVDFRLRFAGLYRKFFERINHWYPSTWWTCRIPVFICLHFPFLWRFRFAFPLPYPTPRSRENIFFLLFFEKLPTSPRARKITQEPAIKNEVDATMRVVQGYLRSNFLFVIWLIIGKWVEK